jgi:hypothetical protein
MSIYGKIKKTSTKRCAMANENLSCQICEKEVDSSSLNSCRGCGKKYCPECKSESTDQKYCKECVGMSGVVTHQ